LSKSEEQEDSLIAKICSLEFKVLIEIPTSISSQTKEESTHGSSDHCEVLYPGQMVFL
jgi:hypothetical protein